MKRRQWNNLIKSIHNENCILILGPAVSSEEKADGTLIPYSETFALQIAEDLKDEGIEFDETYNSDLNYISQLYEKLPDAAPLDTAYDDFTAKVWDASNGALLMTLKGHNDHVNNVIFSLDGKKIASASNDGTAKIWNVENGSLEISLDGHKGVVLSVVFSPIDGDNLVTASADGTVKVCNFDFDINILLQVEEKQPMSYLDPQEIERYNLAMAMESAKGLKYFLKNTPARQLFYFAIYYKKEYEKMAIKNIKDQAMLLE